MMSSAGNVWQTSHIVTYTWQFPELALYVVPSAGNVLQTSHIVTYTWQFPELA